MAGESRSFRRFLACAAATLAITAVVTTTAPAQRYNNDPNNPYNCQLPRAGMDSDDGPNPSATLAETIFRRVDAAQVSDSSATTAGYVSDLNQALAACQSVNANTRRPNTSAYVCIGEAERRLATFDTSNAAAHNRNAACAFSSDLALRRHSYRESTVHHGLAVVLERGGFTNLALTHYQLAVDPQNPAWYFDTARALARAQRYRDADAAYTSGINAIAPSDPVKAADAQLEQAALQTQLGVPDANARQIALYNAAANNYTRAGVSSSGAWVKVGEAYLRDNRRQDARQAFERALPGNTDAAHTAYYYRSALKALSGGVWDDVVADAVSAGPGDPRYVRQLCLALIGRGGARAYGDGRIVAPEPFGQNRPSPATNGAVGPSPSSYCQTDSSPEGKLLRGMYYLRMAQYVVFPSGGGAAFQRYIEARGRYTGYLQNATAAFSEGLSATNQLSIDQRWLDWPGERLRVDQLLQFGGQVAASFNDSVNNNSGCNRFSGGDPAAATVFDRYGLLTCKPN